MKELYKRMFDPDMPAEFKKAMITLEKEGVAQGYVSIGNEFKKQDQGQIAGKSQSRDQSHEKKHIAL